MKRNLYLFLFFLAIGTASGQQYPLFTNYVLNDFGFNPAIAGSTEYIDARLTYRRQWVGIEDAPQTQIVSAQGPMKLFGVGGYLYNDIAGKIRRTGASGAICYGHQFSFGHVGLGMSLGVYNVRLAMDDNTIGTIDPLLAEGASGLLVPDMSMGAYMRMNNGLFVGMSAPQLLKRELKFTDDEVKGRALVPHFYGMVGYRRQLNDKISVEPSMLMKYVGAAPVQFDISVRAFFNNKYWVGGSFRTGSAAAAMLGYEINRSMTLAYAYDLALSDLRQGTSGSHEITIGFKFPAKKDRDGDGVPDKTDQCPDVPGVKEKDGCPAEDVVDGESDRDKDGVLDVEDDCPDVAGLLSNDGCPLGDRDEDGMRDDIDKCPKVFGLASNEGCPLNDRDRDGILDEKDKCPDVPGPISKEGCPADDIDGDGIADALDKCPNTPGTFNNDGCPIASSAEKLILDLAIRNLYFETNESDIDNESFRFLDKLAELLIDRKEWKMKIAGFTDSRGDAARNLELSKERADAVRFYLINRGVSAKQLQVEYYGESKPAASNVSESTRWENRRVEMQFIWN